MKEFGSKFPGCDQALDLMKKESHGFEKKKIHLLENLTNTSFHLENQ